MRLLGCKFLAASSPSLFAYDSTNELCILAVCWGNQWSAKIILFHLVAGHIRQHIAVLPGIQAHTEALVSS